MENRYNSIRADVPIKCSLPFHKKTDDPPAFVIHWGFGSGSWAPNGLYEMERLEI